MIIQSDRSCPANEMPTDCGTNCEPTCTKPNPGACISTCKPDACECKQGYYRNSKKACVKDCAGEPCQANEKRVNANSTCEPTCSLRDPYQNKNVIEMCPKTVVKNVCRCKKGHIRQYDDGPCIPYKQCPPASACDNVSCDAGTICQQKPTYCKTPPCALSQPKCVPATSCDTVTCPPGRVCQVIIAECPVVVHPCPPPTPQCVIAEHCNGRHSEDGAGGRPQDYSMPCLDHQKITKLFEDGIRHALNCADRTRKENKELGKEIKQLREERARVVVIANSGDVTSGERAAT
ncbi:hypothetical protein Q1695_003767 [Nippostrongylus brasiliensis]|nr:hypothetical protein Q1695_003767 [Nippostrongylus brasiliensis]